MANIDLLARIKFSLGTEIVYRIFTGFFGTLLIVLFLSGFMPMVSTVRYIPWIIGFTTMVTGYALVERIQGRIRYQKTAGAGAGFLVAITASIGLNLLSGYMAGVGLLYWTDMLFFTFIGLGFGCLGAILSTKYSAIKRSQEFEKGEIEQALN